MLTTKLTSNANNGLEMFIKLSKLNNIFTISFMKADRIKVLNT
jgi:hypothetical protein